ncbi:putative Ig domain-containing protein [Cereibacter sphaeroides]|uniref:putative Ig domain-containing protein n=1 Tax=Cereibacter sphaeroides TaxID=1063 RepID=UPI001F3A58CF|nr:putative Ig domain-containing protein [Cereibacter sphaeroides]MCE6967566.1 putative Ig domain-containing protein [Cereibacter sphaeroides]
MYIGLGLSSTPSRGSAASPVITATTPPVLGVLEAGDTILGATTAGAYASTAGMISSAVATCMRNGSSVAASTVVAEGDAVSVSVLVTDSAGNTRVFMAGSQTVAYAAPMISSLPELVTFHGASVSINAALKATGSALTYSISGPAWLTINSTTGMITGTAPSADVSTTATVTVTNPGGSASDTFAVVVEVEEAVVNPVVAAVIGQSENVIGFAANGAYYTAGPYPALLPGVDARIAAHESTDSSGFATIHTLSSTEISARTINPGFVALGNLWHLGSSGRPLRLVADVMAGTSLPAMMDDTAGDGREFTDSLELVTLAQSTWGPITSVTYNWWNAEAAVAKTLWASRAPHFFGINPDGTPYDFTAGGIEHCLIDTTGRGHGLYPADAKLNLMLPGLRIETATAVYDPPHLNYRTTSAGAELFGQIDQNAYPSYAARDTALANAPAANRGAVTISPALVRFGDYSGGVQMASPAQTAIHPAMKHKDGQILFAQDVAASLLISEGYAQVSRLDRVVQSPDARTFDFIFRIPAGGVLTTQRIVEGETVATPRPHQQQVMGFVIARGADTDRTMRPLYRTDHTDDALYPPAYRGTATIHDTGTDVAGGREAIVRVVLGTALAAGDRIHWSTEGGSGGWILHGWPDYDARLYRDGLRVYEARLDDGSATRYPGIPVRAQEIYTVLAPADTTAPTLSGISVTPAATEASLAWSTSEGNGTAYWLVDGNASRTAEQVIAAGNSRSVSASGAQATITATGLTASTGYTFHLVHRDAAGNASTVSSTAFTTASEGTAYFTTTGTGPYFLDPANLPANTTRIEYEMKLRLASFPTSGYVLPFAQVSTGCDLRLSSTGGGTGGAWNVVVEDGTGLAVVNVSTGVAVPAAGTWFTVKLDVNQAAKTAALLVNGVTVWSTSGFAGNGVFQSNRALSIGAASGGLQPLRAGTDIEYAEIHLTTGGLRSLRKRVAGAAATVNADPWKAGADAT